MTIATTHKRTLVTSALPYANGLIHLGHIAGAYLPADIYVRYQRMKGHPILFVSGSDEYGVPITLTALKEGISPREVIDRYHSENDKSFADMGISFDIYGRTSWPLHTVTVQEFFTNLYNKGHIAKQEMVLWYSEQTKRFLPDRYVKGTCPKCGFEEATGDECEQCGAQYNAQDLVDPRANIPGDNSTPILKATTHWFLKLQDFQERLKEWLDSHPEWRANVRGISYGWVNELRSRCITRDTDWGVEIPLDDPEAADKRFYVWFDNAIGYVTNTRQWGIDNLGDPEAWRAWWQSPESHVVNFMGKDNVPFHTILFPSYLLAQDGFQLATSVVANEYLNIMNRETGKAEKGSKSKGNMITAAWLLSMISRDAIRYYICAVMPESRDAAFDWDDFMNRYNGELCDVIGNFVHRCLTMTVKNFDGVVPTPGAFDEADQALLDSLPEQIAAIGDSIEQFRFRQAVERLIDMGRKANQYFDAKAPWTTRKTDMVRTATTLHVCCQVVRALCTAMTPFTPDGAARLATVLGVTIPANGPAGGPDTWLEATTPLPAGAPLGTPEVLFPKLEKDYIAELAALHAQGKAR